MLIQNNFTLISHFAQYYLPNKAKMDNKSKTGETCKEDAKRRNIPDSQEEEKSELVSVGVRKENTTSRNITEIQPVENDALVSVAAATTNDDIEDAVLFVGGLQSIAEISEGESRITKTKSALKHFNYFLIWFWKNKDTSSHASYKSYTEITYFCLQHKEFFGEFTTYLAKFAKHGCDPSSPNFLSLNSALGYFSAVKNYFLDLFKTKDELPCFRYRNWKQYSSGILNVISERARAEESVLRKTTDMADVSLFVISFVTKS